MFVSKGGHLEKLSNWQKVYSKEEIARLKEAPRGGTSWGKRELNLFTNMTNAQIAAKTGRTYNAVLLKRRKWRKANATS